MSKTSKDYPFVKALLLQQTRTSKLGVALIVQSMFGGALEANAQRREQEVVRQIQELYDSGGGPR